MALNKSSAYSFVFPFFLPFARHLRHSLSLSPLVLKKDNYLVIFGVIEIVQVELVL